MNKLFYLLVAATVLTSSLQADDHISSEQQTKLSFSRSCSKNRLSSAHPELVEGALSALAKPLTGRVHRHAVRSNTCSSKSEKVLLAKRPVFARRKSAPRRRPVQRPRQISRPRRATPRRVTPRRATPRRAQARRISNHRPPVRRTSPRRRRARPQRKKVQRRPQTSRVSSQRTARQRAPRPRRNSSRRNSFRRQKSRKSTARKARSRKKSKPRRRKQRKRASKKKKKKKKLTTIQKERKKAHKEKRRAQKKLKKAEKKVRRKKKKKKNKLQRREQKRVALQKERERRLQDKKYRVAMYTGFSAGVVGSSGSALVVGTSTIAFSQPGNVVFWGPRHYYGGLGCWHYPQFGCWYNPYFGSWYYPWNRCWFYPRYSCWHYPVFGVTIRLEPERKRYLVVENDSDQDTNFAVYYREPFDGGYYLYGVGSPKKVFKRETIKVTLPPHSSSRDYLVVVDRDTKVFKERLIQDGSGKIMHDKDFTQDPAHAIDKEDVSISRIDRNDRKAFGEAKNHISKSREKLDSAEQRIRKGNVGKKGKP